MVKAVVLILIVCFGTLLGLVQYLKMLLEDDNDRNTGDTGRDRSGPI